jgi:hypothetical protein
MSETMVEQPEGVPEMVHRVAEALRTACLKEFGSTWSYDRSWNFARAAIEAMREPNEEMLRAGTSEVYDLDISGEYWSERIWHAMISAALSPSNQTDPK